MQNTLGEANADKVNRLTDKKITVTADVNTSFVGKTAREDMYAYNWTFETRELTQDKLIERVQAGHSFTAPFAKVKREGRKTPRLNANVIGVQVQPLDSDSGDARSTLDWWKADTFFSQYGSFAYTTESHCEDAPRCRPVFIHEEELTPDEAELTARAFMWRYEQLDTSTKDAGRVFYGSKGCEVARLDNVLPRQVLQVDIIEPYLAEMERQKRAKEERQPQPRQLRQVDATADQVERYVAAAFQRTVRDVSNAVEGTGQRHERLLTGSVRLFSLQKATWLTPGAVNLLEYVEEALLDAARANGYVRTYTEPDTQRVIRSGKDIATPADEPAWKEAGDFFAVGDFVLAAVNGREQRGHVTGVKKDNDNDTWYFELDGGAWWPHSALTKAEPGSGSTNRLEVKPNKAPEDDSEPPVKPPPPRPPTAWTDEALAIDVLEEEADDLQYIDVDQVLGRKEEAKPYFRHTCKSAQLKGAAINIYLEYTTFKPFTDHDWRNCEGCLADYAYRKTRQIEHEVERQQLTVTRFETANAFKRKRKSWNKRHERGADSVAYTPFSQGDGSVVVVHSSTHEADAGQKLPAGDELDAFVLDLCQMPGETKNKATSGFGGEWQGSRGEGRAAEEERETGKRPHSLNLKTNATTARLAKRAFYAELNTRGHGRKDRQCAHMFMELLDWQHQELLEGNEYKLEERFPHGFDNEVVKAIYEDEGVQEALKYYRTYREANELSPLTSTIEKVMDNKGDIQVVEEQLTLPVVTTSTSEQAVLEPEQRPPPATGLPEDNLDAFLDIMKDKEYDYGY